jgi:Trypsin
MAHSFNAVSILHLPRRSRSILPSVLGALVACGAPAEEASVLSRAAQPIFGGRADTEHAAVMLLMNRRGFLCTGTVIHAGDQTGFLLTAAHCVTEEDGSALPASDFLVVPGDDFSESTRAFSVESISVEPGYDGSFAADDIAVVRFHSEDEALSSIPALGPAEDALGVGDALLLVGYGQTEAEEENTERRQVQRTIEALDAQLVV